MKHLLIISIIFLFACQKEIKTPDDEAFAYPDIESDTVFEMTYTETCSTGYPHLPYCEGQPIFAEPEELIITADESILSLIYSK